MHSPTGGSYSVRADGNPYFIQTLITVINFDCGAIIIIMPLVAFTIQNIALQLPESWDAVVISFTKITYTHV